MSQLSTFAEAVSGIHDQAQLTISESDGTDDRFSIVFSSPHKGLVRYVAQVMGCPGPDLPKGATEFTCHDSWQGKGPVNHRELADEITATEGEFFTLEARLGDFATMAANQASPAPSLPLPPAIERELVGTHAQTL